MKRFGLFLLSLVFVLAVGAGSASAKNLRGGVKMQFGLAGEVAYETNNAENDVDLEATIGFAPFIEYKLHKYISVGGLFGVNFWLDENMDAGNLDRNTLLDIDALVRVHYPFLKGKMELYVALPVGLTVSIPSDEVEDGYKAAGQELKTGIGANVSLLAGVAYTVWRQLDLFLELGWVLHYAKHDIEANGQTFDHEGLMNQMALNFGGAWRF